MRNVLSALILLLASATPALAQTGAWAEKLFTTPLSHDFGSVPRGNKIVYQFPVTNIYAVPLKITQLRPSCACLSAVAKPDMLQPQQSGVIEITIDTTRFTGPKSVNLYVSVGPQFISTAMLTVSYNSRADVVLNPGQINFGVVPQGKKVIQSLDVEYAGALDWQVTKVNKDSKAPYDVSIEQLYRNPPNGRVAGKVGYRLTVTLKENAPAGQFNQEVHLETNDPSSKVLNILVEANVQANLMASPNPASFGTIKQGVEVTRKIQIRGNRPFRIVGMEGAGDGVTADYPSQQASNHIITIKCQPTQLGELRKQLTFRTDLDAGVVIVAVDATVGQ